jgi:hypothetical protein
LGITISVSTSSRSAAIPSSAWLARRRPSNENGRVTTPIVSAPIDRAIRATTGAPPVPGATALPGGDEDHVGALEHLVDLLRVVVGRLSAHAGVGACAEPAGELAADVELDVRVAHQQRLGVGIDRDELDPLQPTSIIRFTALTPPPPMPTTLMTAR